MKYRIKTPEGSPLIPSNELTESELREYILHLAQFSEQSETWIEKAQKDPIENLIEVLNQAGFEINKVTK